MPDYSYIQNGYNESDPGASSATVTADSPEAALASAPNIAKNSGVQEIKAPKTDPAPKADTSSPTPPVMRYTGSGTSSSAAPADTFDPAIARGQELAQVQSQINTINTDFATSINRQNDVNAGNEGRARATVARTGNLGSDMGNADISNSKEKSSQAIRTLEAKKQNQLNTIYSAINKDISAKQAASVKQNSTLTTAQNKTLATNSQTYIKNIAKHGGSLSDLSQDEYNHLVETSGLNDAEIHALYAANVPADKILSHGIKGGQYYQVTKDASGETHTSFVPINLPDSYKPIRLPSGQLGFYDPAHPTEIIPYQGPGSVPKTKSSSPGKTPTDDTISKDLADASSAINAGADPVKVRQRFIEKHLKSASLYNNYFKAPAKKTGTSTPSSSGSGRTL